MIYQHLKELKESGYVDENGDFYPDPTKKVGSSYTKPNEVQPRNQNPKNLVGLVYS